MTTFAELGLSESTLAALSQKGFSQPTPIQEKTIPLLLSGDRDVVGQAATGTGKTAAFGLPIIDSIRENAGHVQALVLAPTRELALQVAEELMSLRGDRKLFVLPVFGGQPIGPQIRQLHRGVDIVVGTPGRVMDHLERGTLNLKDISHFVLDEADEMCNMGFVDDVRAILSQANDDRRTLLFSATMPHDVLRIAEEFMNGHVKVEVEREKGSEPLTRQVFHEIEERDRFVALCRVVDADPDFYGLVFCRTRNDTDEVADRLQKMGYAAAPIHGDLNQARRQDILEKFRNRRITILVATDVAARGIDVPDLTHVVNFALPQEAETFVHRVGRTGRAGKEGLAVSLISPREYRRMVYIARNAGVFVKKEPLPSASAVVSAKRERLLAELGQVMDAGGHERYAELALELLQERDPAEVVAALLKNAHGDALDPSSYKEIRHPGPGTAGPGGPGGKRPGGFRKRMTISLGRSHGMTPRKLVDYICRSTRLHPYKIQNVQIRGRESFFTAPDNEVNVIMRQVKDRSGQPLVRVG